MVLRKIQRSFEGSLGSYLIQKAEGSEVKKSGLKHHTFVDSKGRKLSYLERAAKSDSTHGAASTSTTSILILLYGLSQHMEEMASVTNQLDLPSNYRILVPEVLGHGTDISRVLKEGNNYPTQTDIVDALGDFLHHLNLSSPCHLMGYSMGGAAAYHLQVRYPDKIGKVIMISPGLEHVIDDDFLDDFVKGRKSHFAFQDRQSLKILLRDLSPPNRKKKDPIPKFLLQGVVRLREKQMPLDYYHGYLTHLNSVRGKDPELYVTADELPLTDERLVIWPAEDFICRRDKGLEFFGGETKCKFVTINDSGHTFMSDGEPLIFHCLPKVKAFLLQPQD